MDEQKPETSDSGLDIDDKRIKNLLDIGKVAKVKLYQNLLSKIRDGDALTPSQQRQLFMLEDAMNEKLSNSDAPSLKLLGYSDAARYLGFSSRTLSYHVRRKNIEQHPDGKFSVDVLDAFLLKSGFKGTTADGQLVSESKESTALSISQLKLKREEFLFSQLRETLVSRDEVLEEWSARVAELKTGLTNWANALPPILVEKDRAAIKSTIMDEVYSLLDRFARVGRWTPAVKRDVKKKPDGRSVKGGSRGPAPKSPYRSGPILIES